MRKHVPDPSGARMPQQRGRIMGNHAGGSPSFKHRVLFLLRETDTALSLLVDANGRPGSAPAKPDGLRSALQNPELSRMHLAALLRRARRLRKSRRAQDVYWAALMARYLGENANSNAEI